MLMHETLCLLFIVALVAGFIDAIAGGGGLLTIPALLMAGFPPAQVLATNKLQSVGGSFSASLYFIRQRAVDLSEQRVAILFTFFGALCGALLVLQINPQFLRILLPFGVIVIGLYFLVTTQVGVIDKQRRLSSTLFGIIVGSSIGFYDGFLGPGTSSFLCAAYVILAGYNLTKATAHAKVLNFTSNIAALMLFIFSGEVIWSVGGVMLLGQLIGARFGAKMVLTKGTALIRPFIITVSMLISVKLIYSDLLPWLMQ